MVGLIESLRRGRRRGRGKNEDCGLWDLIPSFHYEYLFKGKRKIAVGFIDLEKGEEVGLLILEEKGGEMRVHVSFILPPVVIGGEEEEDEMWFKTSQYAKMFWDRYAKNT